MTPEEAREKYGVKEDPNFEKGYVYCDDCPVNSSCLDKSKTGYQDCWEEIARSTGWPNEDENTVVEMPAFSKRQQEESYLIENMVTLFGIQVVKDYCRCNIYRYTFLSNRKNSPECIQKAQWYMKKLIELEKG